MKDKKNKFASKAKSILDTGKPSGRGDFLEEGTQEKSVRKTVSTEISKTVKPESRTDSPKTVREEFRLPFELAEKLRKHAFETRTTKTATVVEALENLFSIQEKL
jgi:uncharacterized protein (DUF58 family)